MSEPRSPVLTSAVVEIWQQYSSASLSLGEVDDVTLYRDIVHAVSLWSRRPGSLPQRTDSPVRFADILWNRLDVGWFALKSVPMPQAVFATSAMVRPVEIRYPRVSGSNAVVWRKPIGALWTSSFLPDGMSARQYGEASEFPAAGRRLYSAYCDSSALRLFLIDSLNDWNELVERFPLEYEDGSIGVDWPAASRMLDAVRLTARGLLYAENVAIPERPWIATLEGWGAESTAWLRLPSSFQLAPL
jgi:hypothetical protein